MAFVVLLIPAGIALGAGIKVAVDHHRDKTRKYVSVQPGRQNNGAGVARSKGRTTTAASNNSNVVAIKENSDPHATLVSEQRLTLFAQKLEKFMHAVRAGEVPSCKPMPRSSGGLMYPDCIRGSDFISALIQNKICHKRYQALEIARELFRKGCIYHVDCYPSFRPGDYLYMVSSRAVTLKVQTDEVLSSPGSLYKNCIKAKKWLDERPVPKRVGIRSFSPRAVLSLNASSRPDMKPVSGEALDTALVVVGASNSQVECSKVKYALLKANLISRTTNGRYIFVASQFGKGIQETCSVAFGAEAA